jgi:hypothetical protein
LDEPDCRDPASLSRGRVPRIGLSDGRLRLAELHWYEAHGIGKKEFKRKRYVD